MYEVQHHYLNTLCQICRLRCSDSVAAQRAKQLALRTKKCFFHTRSGEAPSATPCMHTRYTRDAELQQLLSRLRFADNYVCMYVCAPPMASSVYACDHDIMMHEANCQVKFLTSSPTKNAPETWPAKV